MPLSPALDPDERHVITVRAHPWLLARPALPLLLLVLVPLVYDLLDLALPGLRLAGGFPIVLGFTLAGLVVYGVKWLLVDLLAWWRRVYILTNRRIITQSGLLSIRRRECPLLKLEESDYQSSGMIARLLDIGDVAVQTSGGLGDILMQSVPHPRHLQSLISEQVRVLREEQKQRRLAETPAEVMRQLQAVLQSAPAPHNAATEQLPPVTPAAVRAQRRLDLLPGEAVVAAWHQHPLVLIAGLLPLAVAALAVIVATALLAVAWLPSVLALLALIVAPWTLWRVLSYRGHQYIVTTERLMDLRRTPPFFERSEIVQLASVQEVSLSIPAVVGQLADVGDVVVEVAGPTQRLSLKTLARPAEFQQRIFETINLRQRRQRQQADDQLVSTLSQWFQEYHKLQQGGPAPPQP